MATKANPRAPAKPPAKPKPKPRPAARPAPRPLPGTMTGANPTLTKTKPPKGGEFLGNRPQLGPGVNAPEVVRGSTQGGQQFTNAQFGQLSPAFRQLADQQYGAIQRIAGGLNNQYTRDARGQVNRAMGASNQMDAMGNRTVAIGDAAGARINALAPQVIGIGDQYMGQIGGLGTMLGDQARQAFATAGPTEIEAELYRQGQNELALGRSLSPEQMREATQSARQGMAARGMATGQAALGAELLNRDRFASQREAQRRAFAADANNLREKNMMDRREGAGRLAEAGGRTMDLAGRMGMAGRELAGNLYDTAGRVRMTGRQIGGALLGDAGRLRLDGARTTADLDPFARAMTPGLSLGQTASGMGLDTIGQSYGNMLDLFANTGSFNVNRGDSLYNSWLNNATAIKTGQTAASAQTNAANISAGATRAARPTWWETALGAVGKIFSDERMKTGIKPVGKDGVLGLTAYQYRYKGDPKKAPKRIGYMAQEVAEVLPEAVEEVNYKGKKRLAIKPAVIGAALANELAAQAA